MFLHAQITAARDAVGMIEGHNLDDQQMMCILKEAHNHNVVAGAGTGKTTTIIGKVKYLLATGRCKPEDILVLSFTHAAAKEMHERLKRNTSADIAVSTFHRFGYHILTRVEGKKPLIFTDPMEDFIKATLAELRKDRAYEKRLTDYFIRIPETDVADTAFKSADEYSAYVLEHAPITIKGEHVKSYGELHVANFLAANGIRYLYEAPYQVNTASEEHAQYRPDFFLPDYGIYIEFFGVDRHGQVPEWFEGDDPTMTYAQGMAWKRALHREVGTQLVEVYAYEDAERILEECLEERLAAVGVILKPVPFEELFGGTENQVANVLKAFFRAVESVINLARNKLIHAKDLPAAAGNDRRARQLAELVSPIQAAYERMLAQRGMIDFSDMLIRAEQCIRAGSYANPFSYVIVDEYQDITASQFRLLASMRQSRDFDLFCVGDDWQSIYRFNGSDVTFTMDFERFWGTSELSRIETTYRFPQSLIDVSSGFVMANPRQIRKAIRSGNTNSYRFAVSKIEGYREDQAIRYMVDRILLLPEGSSVFLIGRYTFDDRLLKMDGRLTIRFDTATQTQQVRVAGRNDLKVVFTTAHKSKGLQADYVFIINCADGKLGFPSQIEDNPLVNLLLEQSDAYPFAEERRLFYVALTRAKKRVTLVCEKDRKSVFMQELEQVWAGQLINETYVCPRCGGRLRVIDGKNGKFFGCENYRVTGCRFTASV